MLTFEQEKKAQVAIEALLPVTEWNPVSVTHIDGESERSMISFITSASANVFANHMMDKDVHSPLVIPVGTRQFIVANFALASVFDL